MQIKYHTKFLAANRTVLLAVCLCLGAGSPRAAADDRPRVQHPNLLLNRQEIDADKAKIKQHPWAARLFDRVKKLADDNGRTNRTPREAALVYALTGDQKYATAVRRALVGNIAHLSRLTAAAAGVVP